MNGYTVYKHTSPGGKVYIGITAQPVARRWHGGSGYKNNRHFFAAIQKYGWDNFTHEIIAKGLTYEDACSMERWLIAKHDSTDPAKGYNLSPGGDKTTLGYKYSEESRRKLSQAMKGKRKGIPHTEAHREHIRQALAGKKHTEARKEMARQLMGDRFNTEEARRKQRENTPKGTQHHRATSVLCIDTGEVFPYIQAAADAKGLTRSSISACCRGIQKTAGGLRWAYKDIGQAAAIEALRLEITKERGYAT